MKILMVGGTFNNEGGRASGFFTKLTAAIVESVGVGATIINGGTYESLVDTVEQTPDVTHLFWFADVPNDLPKLLPGLRERNPDMMLFTSKNNRQHKYTTRDLVKRLNDAQGQYLFEFTNLDPSIPSSPLVTSIYSATGGAFALREVLPSRIGQVAAKLMKGEEQDE